MGTPKGKQRRGGKKNRKHGRSGRSLGHARYNSKVGFDPKKMKAKAGKRSK